MFKGIFVTLLLVSLKQEHLTKCKFMLNLWTLCFKFKKVPTNILNLKVPKCCCTGKLMILVTIGEIYDTAIKL